jgi:hypothetical protein
MVGIGYGSGYHSKFAEVTGFDHNIRKYLKQVFQAKAIVVGFDQLKKLVIALTGLDKKNTVFQDQNDLYSGVEGLCTGTSYLLSDNFGKNNGHGWKDCRKSHGCMAAEDAYRLLQTNGVALGVKAIREKYGVAVQSDWDKFLSVFKGGASVSSGLASFFANKLYGKKLSRIRKKSSPVAIAVANFCDEGFRCAIKGTLTAINKATIKSFILI